MSSHIERSRGRSSIRTVMKRKGCPAGQEMVRVNGRFVCRGIGKRAKTSAQSRRN